eukprot:239420-Prorocentrum_minimum.AAC.1
MARRDTAHVYISFAVVQLYTTFVVENKIPDEGSAQENKIYKSKRHVVALNIHIVALNIHIVALNIHTIARSKGTDVTAFSPLMMSVTSALTGHNTHIVVNPETGHTIKLVQWNVRLNFAGCGKSPVVSCLIRAVQVVTRN